jgi:hypothetical protein
MSKKLSVELSEIQKIIESEWDDDKIRLQVGKYILKKAAEQDVEIDRLLNTKIVKSTSEGTEIIAAGRSCCRGHM